MSAPRSSRILAAIVLVVILAAGLAYHFSLQYEQREGTDIYYNYVEGQRILNGENPYLRILDSDMRVNQKYPTYFPLIYLLSALTVRLGLQDYQTWLAVWHAFIVLAGGAIAAACFTILYPRRGLAAAAFGALFWLFGRWALLNSQASTYDFLPILSLVLAIWVLGTPEAAPPPWPRRLAGYLLLSLSLALKHLDAILVPLFIIWAWQSARPGRRVWGTAWAALAILSIPLITVVPFLIWPGQTPASNGLAMLRSLVFEVTRDPAQHIPALSLDNQLGATGALARVPTLVMLLLVWGAFGQGRIGLYTGSLLGLATFLDFNSVLFIQYLAWMVPFVPLAVAETLQRKETRRDVLDPGWAPVSMPAAPPLSTPYEAP